MPMLDTPWIADMQDAPPPPASQGGVTVTAPGVAAAQPIIDALQAQIAAERLSIEALTRQLVPGLNDAATSAISDQLERGQERLSSLQDQLARAQGQETFSQVQTPPPPFPPDVIPPGAIQIVEMLFVTIAVIAIGVPLARAFGRWLDRRGQAPVAAAQGNLEPRLDRIEQAIEAIAIEVERVSEGQRFTNKLMGELRALPAPNPLAQWPAESAQAAAREPLPVERRTDR
jgi:uncharacterized coiled-coil protein SlyX